VVPLSLSLGQAHHLLNVVHLFKKRRKRRRRNTGGRSNADDNDDDGGDDGVGDVDGGNVRIFNGNYGEWLARVRRAGGVGASSTKKNDDGHCTIAEYVVRLREQDCLFDDARPWVIFAPQDEGHDRKMHRDRRGQDDADDRLGSYGGGGVDRIGRDWLRG